VAIVYLMNPIRRRYFVASCILVASVGATLLGLILPLVI
jgi:hypothetical protein